MKEYARVHMKIMRQLSTWKWQKDDGAPLLVENKWLKLSLTVASVSSSTHIAWYIGSGRLKLCHMWCNILYSFRSIVFCFRTVHTVDCLHIHT